MKNISIKIKVLLLSMVSLLALSFILGTVAINKTKETLIEVQYKQLTTERDSKIKQLQEIFKLYTKQINLLKTTSYVTNLTKDFQDIHNKVGIDPYGSFPINNDEIQKMLPKWDAFYKKYTETYPFNDVYLISQEFGHVIYTYGKKNDFGTNLSNGDYRDSALAKIWKKVKKYKRSVFIDMSAYEPRGGEPSMFIAAPVYIDSKFSSVLVFRINTSDIQDIMRFRSGYANTQEDYLVGPDYLMRSDSFLSPKTHSVKNSFKYPKTGISDSVAVKDALIGNSETKLIQDYRGNNVLSSYTPFKIDEDLTWAMIAEIDENSVLEVPNDLRNTLILISFITFSLVFFLLYIVIQKYIISSLNRFQFGLLDFFKYLNKETNDVKLLSIESKDEIGVMSVAVNNGIDQVKKNIEKTRIEAWIKDGVNKLNQSLINLESIEEVSRKSIDFLSSYTNSGVGVFYIFDENENTLVQYSSYAHIVRDELSNVFKLGEGIIGQVGFQKKPILLKNIKKDENLITTGTITQASYNTYTFPLIYNEKLYAVIELGSFNEFNEEIIEFLNASTRNICISLSATIQNNKVKELLENTKKANKELELNQLKLEEANTYMEEQQQQLEEANANMEEQQQQLEEANANMEEQQQQLKISEQNLKLQNQALEENKKDIQKKAEELEISGKYKSEFLANMSHELRTPLNSIILLSSLLQRNSKATLNNDDIKKAKTIFESGNELLRLINDILDLSKVESGNMQVIVDNFNSSDLLAQIKDTFEYSAIEKGLTFNIIDEYKQNISNDRDRISQVIRNLLSNALKFTKEGSITLKISASKDKDFRISIIDTGIGIALDKQDLIFKAFTQADGGTSREFGGTGLGLSISKEFAKLLGGYISLESQENVGSTFSIDLPNLEDDNIKQVHIEEKPKSKTVVNKNIPIIEIVKDDRDNISSSDETYLIIDDDKMFSEVVYEEVKKNGNNCLIALSATSGLELIKKYNIKGIMLDLTLPDMDGIDVLKELKSNKQTSHIPVHIISSKDKDNQTLKLGAIGYLQKPVYDGDINNIINSIDSFQEKEIKDLLIVEDNQVQREALIELIGEGVNITGVKSAQEAINEVKKEKYDTVVIDLGLMEGSGYEVCEYIKNSYPKLPIIIYTGKELNADDKIKLQKYSNSIIIKTVNSNERILNEINLFLHRDSKENQESKEIFESIDLHGTNILIVDDDIKNIFVLDAALKEFNANTHTAFNGKEALEFLEKNPNVDLVLMDIMMPIMNGYEAIEKIREDERIKHIPIITVTAKAMKEDREKCISIGADDYLSKPIDINILANLIKLWSRKKHK